MKSICVECGRVFETDRTSWLKDFCDECLREIAKENAWDDREDRGDWEYHQRVDERGPQDET